MIIIISKNYLKNALASAIFSVLSMRYRGYTYLRSLPCISHAQVSSAYVRIELNYILWLRNRTVLVGLSVENLLVIQGVTLCSVLSGSAIPFPASEGKSVKISVLRGILSGTMSSQLQSLVLWLRLFSWRLIITLLIVTLPLRSGTTG